MRRLALGLLTALFLLSGCGQSTAAGFGQGDFHLEIAGAEYRCDDNIETVIAALGDDYEYSEGLSCAYDGMDKTYSYDVAEFYTNPLPEGDLVSEIYTENQEVSTSQGIAVGATREEVLSAHGDDCDDTGNLIIYRVPGSGNEPGRGALCFEMDGDRVLAIFVTTEPV